MGGTISSHMKSNVQYLLDLEKSMYRPSVDYTTIQTRKNPMSRNQRIIVIDYIDQLTRTFRYTFQTFTLAIIIFDAYMNLTDEPTEKWQIISCMCLFLASCVLQYYQDTITDYIFIINGGADSRPLFETVRLDIIKVLGGEFIRPTQYHFLNAWLEEEDGDNWNSEELQRIQVGRKSLIYLSLLEPALMTYKSSDISAAIYLMLVRTKFKGRHATKEVTEICKILDKSLSGLKRWKLDNDMVKGLQEFVKLTRGESACLSFGETSTPIHRKLKTTTKIQVTPSKLTNKIGEGVSAQVFKIIDAKKDYAAKYYSLTDNHKADPGAILNELAVPFSGMQTFQKGDDYGIFLFFGLASVDLYSFRKNDKGTHYNTANTLKYFKEITEGLACLHYNDIIHGDIKPENIVWYSDSNTCKIIDFGLSSAYASFRTDLPKEVCTSTYRPPEAWLGQGYDYKLDVWSLGMVLYYMVTGNVYLLNGFNKNGQAGMITLLFETFGTPDKTNWPTFDSTKVDKNNQQVIDLVKYDVTKHKKFVKDLGDYYNLAKPCLELDPVNRISAKKLLKCINHSKLT